MTEHSLFSQTLSVLRAGFELRKPDAWDNALLLRDKYAREGRDVGAIASHDRATDKAREALMRAHAIDELMQEFRNANLLQERGRFGPTPETSLHPGRENSIAALIRAGHLDRGQELAAEAIAEVVEGITASLHARGGTALRSTGGARMGDFLPPRLGDWYSYRYLPWVGGMFENMPPDMRLDAKEDGREYQHLKLVMTVVVEGISLDTARRPLGMGWSRALRLLRNGLALYAYIAEAQEAGYHFGRLRKIALGKGRTV